MKNCIIILLLVFVSALGILAQQQAKSIKVDEFDLKTEGLDAFEARAAAFLKVLAGAEKSTGGLITIYENEEAAAKLNELLVKDADLRKRISLFVPGVLYPKKSHAIEFWLVPEGADSPYIPECALGLCDCASISISNSKKYTLDSLVEFSVILSGSSENPIKYSWKVDGGEITLGQGTPKIKVKPIMSDPKDITATVEITYPKPWCLCPTTATSTSKLHL